MDIRQRTKSQLAEQAKEAALDAGMTVLVCRADSTTRQRRRKHLTLIEDVRTPKVPFVMIDDTTLRN